MKRTTLNLGLDDGQAVRAFGGIDGISVSTPSGFLVFGTRGLLRRVDEAMSGEMSGVRLDLATTESFISYGDGWAGTDVGQI